MKESLTSVWPTEGASKMAHSLSAKEGARPMFLQCHKAGFGSQMVSRVNGLDAEHWRMVGFKGTT